MSKASPRSDESAQGEYPGLNGVGDDGQLRLQVVSRRHAEFRRENGEYLVVDTGSLNGTSVNRKPVESVALANGDEIQMGKFRLVFLTRPTTH